MRNAFKAALLAAVLAAIPVLSSASQGPPNQEEMAPLQYLIGTWNCTWQAGTSTGSEQQVFTRAFDGAWLEEKEIANGQVSTIHYTGYDPAKKMYVHIGPDADGTYELAQSPDAVNWQSTDGAFVHHKVSDTKTVLTQTGGDRFSITCVKI